MKKRKHNLKPQRLLNAYFQWYSLPLGSIPHLVPPKTPTSSRDGLTLLNLCNNDARTFFFQQDTNQIQIKTTTIKDDILVPVMVSITINILTESLLVNKHKRRKR